MCLGHLGKIRESRSNGSHIIDLLDQHAGNGSETFLKFLRIFHLQRTQHKLDIQLHRSQRIFNFMSNLPRHFTPGTLSFRFCQLHNTFIQLIHHIVVFFHQAADFIGMVINNFLIFPSDMHFLQFIVQHLQRPGNTFRHQTG